MLHAGGYFFKVKKKRVENLKIENFKRSCWLLSSLNKKVPFFQQIWLFKKVYVVFAASGQRIKGNATVNRIYSKKPSAQQTIRRYDVYW